MEFSSQPASIERELPLLQHLQNEKWRRYGPDVLPAFVAEMDFAIAEPIRHALAERVARQDFGYPLLDGKPAASLLCAAYVERMKKRFGWQPDPACVLPMGDLVQALYAAVVAFSAEGDGIIVLEPSYPKIREAVMANQRRLLPLTMRDNGQRLAFDPDELEQLAGSASMLILCNPHNPSGRVFSREELMQIGSVAERHGLIVVVDEVHADLVYPGAQHLPFAALDPALAARSLVLYSATKSFNIPGLRCAMAAFGATSLYQRFCQKLPPRLLGDPNVFGMDATLVAWSQGEPWFSAVLGQLQQNRDHLLQRVAADLPGVVMRQPQATYLAWLDCTALQLAEPAAQFFLRQARVALSPGEAFIGGGEAYVRFNFATSPQLVDQILQRMQTAIAQR